MRTFIYCRVSTREQDTQNQVLAIERAGYKVPESRVISEDISGSVQAMQRPKFRAMVEHKLEAGDQLVVLKLDRLGRDNIDVQQTIDMLLERGVKVVSLDLPARDLTSSEGKLIRQMFGALLSSSETVSVRGRWTGWRRRKPMALSWDARKPPTPLKRCRSCGVRGCLNRR